MMKANLLYPLGAVQLFLTVSAVFSSCDSLFDAQEPHVRENAADFVQPEEMKYVITVHELYDVYSNEKDFSEVNSFSGGTVRVIAKPLISSKEILAIEAQARPRHDGFCNLSVTLTPEGKEKWIQLFSKYNDKDIALLIDGEFYRSFRPREFLDEENSPIIIDGPIDKITANNIALYSRYNYAEIEKLSKTKENK